MRLLFLGKFLLLILILIIFSKNDPLAGDVQGLYIGRFIIYPNPTADEQKIAERVNKTLENFELKIKVLPIATEERNSLYSLMDFALDEKERDTQKLRAKYKWVKQAKINTTTLFTLPCEKCGLELKWKTQFGQILHRSLLHRARGIYPIYGIESCEKDDRILVLEINWENDSGWDGLPWTYQLGVLEEGQTNFVKSNVYFDVVSSSDICLPEKENCAKVEFEVIYGFNEDIYYNFIEDCDKIKNSRQRKWVFRPRYIIETKLSNQAFKRRSE
jgi:hypothetical protein